MKTLFDETSIGNLTFKNRLVRSATGDGVAMPDGHLTDDLFAIYEGLAKGGVGWIFMGFTGVVECDPFAERITSLADDAFIAENAKLVEMIHRYDCVVMPQMGLGSYSREVATNERAVAGVNEMTLEDIAYVKKRIIDAAWRAQQAGFDGVQLHGCHKVLLSEFLRPKRNHRRDEYGGSVEGRTRIVCEIIRGIHERCGDFHVSIKLNNTDVPKDECLEECRLLEEAGLDSLEMEWLYPQLHAKMRKEIHIPLILTGEHRDPTEMEQLMVSEGIEYFGMSRPLIREDDLPNRWQRGDRRPAICISCDKCLEHLGSGCVFRK